MWVTAWKYSSRLLCLTALKRFLSKDLCIWESVGPNCGAFKQVLYFEDVFLYLFYFIVCSCFTWQGHCTASPLYQIWFTSAVSPAGDRDVSVRGKINFRFYKKDSYRTEHDHKTTTAKYPNIKTNRAQEIMRDGYVTLAIISSLVWNQCVGLKN